MNVVTECPVCKAHDIKTEAELYDDRYGYPGNFELMSCRSCRHKYLAGDLPASLADLYTQYYPRSNFDIEQYCQHKKSNPLVSWLNGGMSTAFRWVPENVRVLDIGCGFGEALGYHAARGCEVHGVDADANILRVGERFGYNVKSGVFDPANYQPEYFDFVTMDQVIEHVPDPAKLLSDVAKVLKPYGVCVLSTPNVEGLGVRTFGKRWLHWHAPYHLHFFSSVSMTEITQTCGLVVEKNITVTRSEWILYQLIHMLIYPRRGEVSRFWGGNTPRTLIQKIGIRGIMALRFTLIPQVVSRMLDFFGVGDNSILILRKGMGDDCNDKC